MSVASRLGVASPCARTRARVRGQAKRGARAGVESAAGRSKKQGGRVSTETESGRGGARGRRAGVGPVRARQREEGREREGRRKEKKRKEEKKRKWKMEKEKEKEKEGEREKGEGGGGIRAVIATPGRPRAASGTRARSGVSRGSRVNRERAGVGNRTLGTGKDSEKKGSGSRRVLSSTMKGNFEKLFSV